MNFRKNYQKESPQFMIIPMIDIIFFLLVFFMMNSMETVTQKALDVRLPQAKTASAATTMPLIVTLDEKGHITRDGKPVSLEELKEQVTQAVKENPNTAVILQADERAVHGQVVAIMDILKGAGIHKLSIAAQ